MDGTENKGTYIQAGSNQVFFVTQQLVPDNGWEGAGPLRKVLSETPRRANSDISHPFHCSLKPVLV